MNREGPLLQSWLLWSTAYYLYYPFLSIYLSSFIQEDKLSLVYAIFQAISLPYAMLGAKLYWKNKIMPIIIGMLFAGVGLILLPFSTNLISIIIYMSINYMFFLSLPSYYSLMAEIGEGVITRIWSLSILPSIIMPSIGGIIAQYTSLRLLFIISGIIFSLSFLPMLKFKPINNNADYRVKTKLDIKIIFIPILTLPIAMAFPYIYLAIYTNFNLSKDQVGVIATIAEILGMGLSYLASKFIKEKKYLLSLSLILFSLIVFYSFSPAMAIFFGAWEAIIPLTLEYFPSRKSPEDFAIINVMQGLGWIMGYIVDYTLGNINLLLVSSGIIAFLSACIILISKK
ncbi:MAG: hypothetical protein QXF96_07305 [Saccharolobus sp.]